MKQKKVYVIGIEGAGTSALATLYHSLGYEVSGSDDGDGFYAEILTKKGIKVWRTFAPEHVPETVDWVVYSTAFAKNVETQRSQVLGLKTLSYPEAIALLFNDAFGIAVAGTHGKTTTTALLTEVLAAEGLDPTAVVGARVNGWEGNIRKGEGQYFVLEADEYQNKLALYHPFGAIVTSVDWDHPDFFPTVESYEAVFRTFVTSLPRHGFVVVCSDHARAEFLTRDLVSTRLTYGFLAGALVRAVDHRILDPHERKEGLLQEFFVEYADEKIGPFRIRLAGRHNVQNALAVIATGLHLKLDREKIKEGLARFVGTKRRFEYIGEHKGGLVYDDYAHHPAEIQATLSAFRDLYPKHRLFVIFHPHTFTRTKALLEDFAESFSLADGVAVSDIYGSARETQGGVSAQDLVDRINARTREKAVYARDRSLLAQEIRASMGSGVLVVTMGAGDVWRIAQEILKP